MHYILSNIVYSLLLHPITSLGDGISDSLFTQVKGLEQKSFLDEYRYTYAYQEGIELIKKDSIDVRLNKVKEAKKLYQQFYAESLNAGEDISGAIADLNDLIEKDILKDEAKYIIKEILHYTE